MRTKEYSGELSRLMYVLDADGRTPITVPGLMTWAKAAEKSRRNGSWRVALDYVGRHEISTVFLGLDHNHRREGPPLLFETMVFSQPEGWMDCERCSTWDEAEKQHQRRVEEVRGRAGGAK